MAKTPAKMGHHEGFTLDMVELVEYNNIPCKTNTFRS